MTDPRALIVDLCRQFFTMGWVSGTGGGLSIRDGQRIFMAPSGVQKERLRPEQLFEIDLDGKVLSNPGQGLELSACAPLFLNAFRIRDAGAVLHSHSMAAMLVTLLYEREFRVTHLEMMKGISGVGYHDQLVVPIIENTAHERDLADAMAAAMRDYPDATAVLVRRHGIYVWGRDWAQAKTQAECFDYLFDAALRMKQLGFDPAIAPEPSRR